MFRPSRLIPFAALLVFACVTPGAVIEKKPVAKPLGGYTSAALVMAAADPSATNAAQKVSACRNSFEVQLNASRVFPAVLGEAEQAQAALVLKATFVDQTQSVLGVEEKHKKVQVMIDFIDAADQSTVGAVEVLGTSDTGSTTTVGGVDTDAFADLYPRACQAAAEQLGNYLKSKK